MCLPDGGVATIGVPAAAAVTAAATTAATTAAATTGITLSQALAIAGAIGSAASLGVGLAGSAGQSRYQQQQAQARQQQIEQNQVNATQAFGDKAQQENNRLAQLQVAQAQKKQQASVQALEASSTLANSSMEAGVGGLSIEALQADYERQQAMLNQSIDYNTQLEALQRGERIKGYRAMAIEQGNSLQPFVQDPSQSNGLALALQGVGDITQSFQTLGKANEKARNSKRLKLLGLSESRRTL